MAQNIFKNLGKSPSQIHKPNLYAQSLNETKSKGMYEKSVEALSPTTYQEGNKLNFQFAKWFAFLYHFISAGLGLATVSLLAFIFSGAGIANKYPTWLLYSIFGLAFIVLSVLLVGIEIFKSSLAKTIFKNLVVGSKVGIAAVIGLVTVMAFSILVSALGGAILSTKMNDKSTEIKQIYSVQSDSIRKQHDDNLQAVNASIQAHTENLQKGDYWAKYATREKLDKAIETRNNLLTSAKSDIMGVQAAKNKEVFLNSMEGENFALISAIIVLFLEMLSILAYYFQYTYHANCEKEAVNFSVLSAIVVELPQEKTEIQEMKELLQNFLNSANQLGGNPFQLNSNSIPPNSHGRQSAKLGFTFGLKKEAECCPTDCRPSDYRPTENEDSDNRLAKIAVDENGVPSNRMPSNGMPSNRIIEGNRICKHCGEAYIYKHHKQQYCAKECRDTAWEHRTGKKLIFKKSTIK